MTSPAVTPSNLDALEFEKRCDIEGCSRPAAWAVWVVHNAFHRKNSAIVCSAHKKLVETYWGDIPGTRHDCGFVFPSGLSDNFRTIKL